LFDALETQFTREIQVKIESILAPLVKDKKVDRGSVQPGHPSLKPNYKIIFKNDSANPNRPRSVAPVEPVEFSDKFDQELTAIAQDPDFNTHPTFCIRAVGYGYIVGALESAGFFDSKTGEGIWLTGDYTGAQNYPYIRIKSLNDGLVAQATTAFKMAELFVLLRDRELFKDPFPFKDAQSSSEKLLKRLEGESPWVGKTEPLSSYTVTHCKVGHEKLKQVNSGQDVFSEAFIMEDKAKQAYVIVYQNYDRKGGDERIGKIIKDTISGVVSDQCGINCLEPNPYR
jgi:hypothetical protein